MIDPVQLIPVGSNNPNEPTSVGGDATATVGELRNYKGTSPMVSNFFQN
jgi:hypothetical protein